MYIRLDDPHEGWCECPRATIAALIAPISGKRRTFRLRTRNCFSRVRPGEGESPSCRLQFRDSPSGYNVSPVARPHGVLCVSLARSVRIHTTRIPISDIHLSPRRGFCHRRRRHCAGLHCHNSVGLSLRNATTGVHGSPMLPSVHCGTGV